MKIRPKLSILLYSFIFFSVAINAYDNTHFYRASYLFPEPRFERHYLTTLDATFAGGSTESGRNFEHDIVPLLDIYGTHNMHDLGVNIPNLDENNPLDRILINLANVPTLTNFATFSIEGKFKILEGNFSYIQNLAKGFFAQIHFPVRNLKIKSIRFVDLSPINDLGPNINTPEWQQFLQNFDAILEKHNLSSEQFNQTGIGDLTTYLGWTHNFQDTERLDYIDYTFQVGFLAPTGKKRNEDKIFSLPLGYNGHWGFTPSFALSFGAYEWLTWGGYIKAIFFANRTRTIRLKTARQQSGIIKLAKGNAKIKTGKLWHAGIFFEADHFARGFSLTLAYSFAGKNKNNIRPRDLTFFDPSVVNSDEMLKRWNMHVFHLFVEYDFTQKNFKIGPRIGFFYNGQIGGKRTFKTTIFGGSAGLEIAWDM